MIIQYKWNKIFKTGMFRILFMDTDRFTNKQLRSFSFSIIIDDFHHEELPLNLAGECLYKIAHLFKACVLLAIKESEDFTKAKIQTKIKPRQIERLANQKQLLSSVSLSYITELCDSESSASLARFESLIEPYSIEGSIREFEISKKAKIDIKTELEERTKHITRIHKDVIEFPSLTGTVLSIFADKIQPIPEIGNMPDEPKEVWSYQVESDLGFGSCEDNRASEILTAQPAVEYNKAELFYKLLTAAARGEVKLYQDEPYSEIKIVYL